MRAFTVSTVSVIDAVIVAITAGVTEAEAKSDVSNFASFKVPKSARAGFGPPELDVRLSCRAADRALPITEADKPRADMRACLDDERTARDALVKAWAGFTADARSLCVGMNRTGGPPSYVELLTCLEVMRDAGKSP
jgi:hypothetical protein